jgi:hypothetical protein
MNYDLAIQEIIDVIKADKAIVQPWRNKAVSHLLDARLSILLSNLDQGLFVERCRAGVIEIAQKRIYKYPDGVCTYCGFVADTIDHLLPRAFTGDALRLLIPTVPACNECNTLIGDTFCVEIQERRSIVHDKIQRRYRTVLKTASFTSGELEGMGYALRSSIEMAMDCKKLIDMRLKWPTRDDYDFRYMEII